MNTTEENAESRAQRYEFRFGERNPDTELLAALLHAEYEAVLASDPVALIKANGVDDESVAKLVWYRIAERAKELRA